MLPRAVLYIYIYTHTHTHTLLHTYMFLYSIYWGVKLLDHKIFIHSDLLDNATWHSSMVVPVHTPTPMQWDFLLATSSLAYVLSDFKIFAQWVCSGILLALIYISLITNGHWLFVFPLCKVPIFHLSCLVFFLILIGVFVVVIVFVVLVFLVFL